VFLQVALDEELPRTKSEKERKRERKTLKTNRHIDKHNYKP
jgi:hypothetical protein